MPDSTRRYEEFTRSGWFFGSREGMGRSPGRDTGTDEHRDRRARAPDDRRLSSTRTEEAFCGLFDAFYARLLRYYSARGVERTAAEELSENVMFQVYRRVSQPREERSFHSWIFQIARNEWLQHRRRAAASPVTVAPRPRHALESPTLESVT